MSDTDKTQLLIGAAVVAALLGLPQLAGWLIQTAVMGLVGPWLFIAQLYAFAATLPSPLDTVAVLFISGAIIVFGVGAFAVVATIWNVVSNAMGN